METYTSSVTLHFKIRACIRSGNSLGQVGQWEGMGSLEVYEVERRRMKGKCRKKGWGEKNRWISKDSRKRS